MDFKAEVEQHFTVAIACHRLRVLPFDQSEIILVGNGFALSISYDREGVEVGYIEPVSDNSYVFHRITNMIGMNRFLAEDRKLFGNPNNTIEEHVRASLRVIASGLTNRCKDILNGDKIWLENLRKKDRLAWKGELLNTRMLSIIASELSVPPKCPNK